MENILKREFDKKYKSSVDIKAIIVNEGDIERFLKQAEYFGFKFLQTSKRPCEVTKFRKDIDENGQIAFYLNTLPPGNEYESIQHTSTAKVPVLADELTYDRRDYEGYYLRHLLTPDFTPRTRKYYLNDQEEIKYVYSRKKPGVLYFTTKSEVIGNLDRIRHYQAEYKEQLEKNW